MQVSYYNYYLDNFSEKSYGLIYNAKTGSILKIEDRDIWDSIQHGTILELSADAVDMLRRYGICVESHENELDDIRQRYEKRIYGDDELYVTLLPTEGCNFACPYCFVYEKQNRDMQEEIYDLILKFIVSHCREKKTKIIYINWFGGEPTLFTDRIVKFMNEVKSKLQNVEIYSSITTNGYLLDISSFSELLKSGVKYFQVTIDGTKEVHDASRYLRNHEGTYDVIMKNLEDISALPHDVIFNMDIRSNFRKSTFASVNDFLDVYIKKFGNDPRFHAYCRPVYYYETKDGEIDSMVSDLYSLEEGIEKQNMLSEKIVRFSAEKIAHRIFDPLPQPTDYWCNAEAHNHAIVGPEGELYICDTMTGEKYVKGNIKTMMQLKESLL